MFMMKQAIERQVADISRVVGLEEIDMKDYQSQGITAMHYAAWYNNHQAVETLIDWEHGVMSRDHEGATPLHYVARYKHRVAQIDASGTEKPKPSSPRKVIQALMNAGADLNARDSMGVTALVNATLRGNKEAVEELLRYDGIDVLSADKRGVTSLHVAAKYDRADIARLLVESGADVIARDDLGKTAMHLAAEENEVDIMMILYEGMSGRESEVIDARTEKNEAPIDLAIENRNREAVEFCLKYGALVRKTCRTGFHTPMHMACAAGAPRIVKLLIDKDPILLRMRSSDLSTPLHRAVQFDRPVVTKLLLENDVDIDARDDLLNSPLLVAVMYGAHRPLMLLIEHGAQLDALNKKDRTVLHIAAEANRPKTLKICLDHIEKAGTLGRLISSDDRSGNSPLHMAAQNGHEHIVEILINHGANIRNKNEKEATALHAAAEKGCTAVVRHLLKVTEEMDDDAQQSIMHDEDEDGNTPLHLAAINGHPKVVELLLKSHAQHDTINRRLWTPLLGSAARGHVDCMVELLKADCDLEVTDGNKNSPLHLAAYNGHEKVIETLLEYGAKLDDLNDHGHNPLDLALLRAHREVAEVIVRSERWRDSLRNRSQHGSSNIETTPLRQLIRKMPDVAEIVLDQCIHQPEGTDILDPKLTLDFEFEFLDDSYTSAYWGTNHDNEYDPNGTFDSRQLLRAEQISVNRPMALATNAIENHVLMSMVKARRSELLHHPLCLALMQQKWRLAQFFFFTFLFYYVLFVAGLTTYFLYETPPYLINVTFNTDHGDPSIHDCAEQLRIIAEENQFIAGSQRMQYRRMFLYIMSVIGMSVEVLQLYHSRLAYFDNFTNSLDWFTYIAAICAVVPIGNCGLRLEWQWKLGAICMFCAWINLILFLRRLPSIGLYIVMVGEVFITFTKFFIFCFSLFLFAFSFTFFMLFGNQEQFRTPMYAFFKMAVMMIGELDYGDMFHPEDPGEAVVYETTSYLIFLMFLCMVTMVIMNLLTGLAVGDVQEVQMQASLKRMALQVGLALDVENCIPLAIRKKLHCHRSRVSIQPNKTRHWLVHKMVTLMDGPMASVAIAKSLYREYEEELEEAREGREESTSGGIRISHIIAQVNENRDQLKAITKNVDRMQTMLEALLRHSNVQWQEEEGGKKSRKK